MLKLCLDIGNTHVLGGVINENKIMLRFRYATQLIGTADQFGIFLIQILQANHIPAKKISAVAISSVVPSYDYTIRHMITRYFDVPCFVLQSGVKTGLNIKYKNPNEVGADRIANAMGAVTEFPNKNIIIVDMGTATTVCVITKKRDYLGGAILPGMRLGMEALKNHTAKLMAVDIEIPTTYIGRTTRGSIQAGLYYGQLGALREIIAAFKREAFPHEDAIVIGTGGFSQLFKDKQLFDVILPDLVLHGLNKAYLYSLALN
ncbi:MAG: pantothenate kinase [Gammaproteobacteria bacterium RIFCSPHIGHO2_12_FULL_37_34]|nr:MAG: pantothenate kinase [Gammaproteobacteria bacterium RIFCSPHIGHO2_12_FULL_37_34]